VELPNPEQIASELLVRAGVTYPPVILDQITKLWPGLRISYEDLDKEGFLVDLGSRGGEIIVKITDVTPRRRFTIAHELGHWVLQAFHDLGMKCSGAATVRNRFIEKWCDEFAGALLMPKGWLTQQIRTARVRGLTDFILNGPKKYEVSHEAFRKRVSHTTPISICELALKNGATTLFRSFPSGNIRESSLMKVIGEARSHLLDAPEASLNKFLVDGFVVLHKKVNCKDNTSRWVLCIFPAPTRTKISEPTLVPS
jgi:hypothetical protein